MEDHAFTLAATAGICTGDCTPLAGFFAGVSAASLAAALRTRRVGVIRCASGDYQKLLKVAVFGEDIRKRLFHHIISRCVDESGVLIDPALRSYQ